MCSMGFFNNRSGNSFIFILFASNNNECVVIVKTTNSTATKIQTDALLLKQCRCVDYIIFSCVTCWLNSALEMKLKEHA